MMNLKKWMGKENISFIQMEYFTVIKNKDKIVFTTLIAFMGFVSCMWHGFCFLFLFVCLLVFVFCFLFWHRVSLCSPGCPRTHSVDQTGLVLRNPPASASQVLACPAAFFSFLNDLFILFVWVHCYSLQTHQRRASHSIRDGGRPPCGCWEMNSCSLGEQSVLLTAEPSL